MNIPSNPISPGQVIYLAGPSSTGKSTYSSELIKSGWLHFEADHFLSVTEINHVEKFFKEDLALIRQALSEEHRSPERILGIIMGDKPEITPDNQEKFNKARTRIKECLDQRWTTRGEPDDTKAQQNWQEVFINMLDEANKASTLGKNVIIDFVGMIGERPEVSAPGLKIEKESPNIWDYKGLKIEQFLKYASIDRLAQNIFRRNQQIDNKRDPMYVLNQYGERFKKSSEGDEVVGKMSVNDLTKWIERFVKIEHLKLDYTNFDQIDEVIQKSMTELSSLEIEELNKKIALSKAKMFSLMEIEEGDEEISLTYRTNDKAKPTII
ncbi:MAG: hypothetical protein BGO10_01450 [Chlamydia sp. 32-24]|mgnify:CR=1 FL=1|nr:MAG: hypothetical protein BGO10_01450 [Chlamydia sp. 32-24]